MIARNFTFPLETYNAFNSLPNFFELKSLVKLKNSIFPTSIGNTEDIRRLPEES